VTALAEAFGIRAALLKVFHLVEPPGAEFFEYSNHTESRHQHISDISRQLSSFPECPVSAGDQCAETSKSLSGSAHFWLNKSSLILSALRPPQDRPAKRDKKSLQKFRVLIVRRNK
jgi:hypothetical protein